MLLREVSVDLWIEDYIKWKPADHGFTKLNFDGSIVSNHGAFIVFVIRDEDGRHVLVGTRKVNAFHVPITETLALREDLRSAMRQHLFKVQVECDSKLIIDCVLNKCSIPWCLKVIIKDIRHLAAQFQEIQFVQNFREANFTADAIVNIGHSSSTSETWDRCLPPSVLPAFHFDPLIVGCPRGFLLYFSFFLIKQNTSYHVPRL